MEDNIVIKSEFMFDEGDSNNEQQIESNGKKSRCAKTKECQYKKIISFIEEQSNFKGIYDRQKLSSEQWKRLTIELNAIGPPEHTIDEWKKVWTDFKGNRKRKNRLINETPLDPLEMCVVSRNLIPPNPPLEDSKLVAESQYDVWTINDQSNASNETLSQSNTQQEREITTMENFHSEILNRIDLVVGEQARLNMKMDVLMEQQLRLQENFEKILKVVEEKGSLPK